MGILGCVLTSLSSLWQYGVEFGERGDLHRVTVRLRAIEETGTKNGPMRISKSTRSRGKEYPSPTISSQTEERKEPATARCQLNSSPSASQTTVLALKALHCCVHNARVIIFRWRQVDGSLLFLKQIPNSSEIRCQGGYVECRFSFQLFFQDFSIEIFRFMSIPYGQPPGPVLASRRIIDKDPSIVALLLGLIWTLRR
jgi:hypothetical protein